MACIIFDYAGAGWGSGGVGARVRDPSWVGEGHDSTIKVDDAGRPVKCDP